MSGVYEVVSIDGTVLCCSLTPHGSPMRAGLLPSVSSTNTGQVWSWGLSQSLRSTVDSGLADFTSKEGARLSCYLALGEGVPQVHWQVTIVTEAWGLPRQGPGSGGRALGTWPLSSKSLSSPLATT